MFSITAHPVNSKTLHSISKLLLCFTLLCTYTAIADDGAFMSKLAKALSPTPSGWSGSSFCDWKNVRCTTNRVTSINIASQSLTGTLPPDLNSLSQLTSLSLQGNALAGALPSLANLSMLQTVFLGGNNFTSIPNGCFQGLTSLQSLSMADSVNLAQWAIPAELTQSTNLVKLDLGNTNLIGTLPDVFDSLLSLQELRLSYNNLTGGLPKTFAGSGIQYLWLNNQKDGFGFSGTIEVLASMTHLSQVWFQKNLFTGAIPDLSNCTTLFDLQLRYNQLTGVVPPSLISLSSLQNVSLDNNMLQGPFPSFGKGVKVTLEGVNSFCRKDSGPCDSRVTTLLDIAKDFGYPVQLARSWIGNDPCNDWSFVVCGAGKIVTVNLAKQNLTGTISPAFANLTDLRNLYLNDNHLGGSIPGGLTNLAQLEVLDVTNNNLSGDAPKFPTKVKFSTTGNPLLGHSGGGGGSGTTPSSDSGDAPSGSPNAISSDFSLSPAWIAGIVVIAVFFVALVLLVFFVGHTKNWYGRLGKVKNLENEKKVLPIIEGECVIMPIHFLRQVTKNFSEENILGRGGFGVVYRGELEDGNKIAVKRMKCGSCKGTKELEAEIVVLRKVRHRHLVAFLGHCIENDERVLVYEYMPQGTLSQHLFSWRENDSTPLSWKQRVTIALDVARGVEYLHRLAQQSFIHRDLKPSNILLGDDMRAKVADFGLVKIIAPGGKDSVWTQVAGTLGYLEPEYAATGRVTRKVDVYAFGVVLMELISGRKALDNSLDEEMWHLVPWFRRIVNNMENILQVTDESLNLDDETMESICKVAELACHCTAPEPHKRPDMGHGVNVLVPLVEQWNPISTHQQEEGCDVIYEENYDMSISEIFSGR
ncbi:leucine-rich repeat family protein [Vigna unguiculata]|uniref:Leucine-rich repeat family protein n=1 Tax=Vigna unguiculata TaxID=3917 RepID=A0A4D6NKC2_VIGUN|nr:leucine-rich repeat family protein [Vigna unguiculata]